MELEELKNLLVDIFRLDKTPEYDHIGVRPSKRHTEQFVMDRFGRLPSRGEQKWLTPREIVLEEWRKLGLFEQELYDLAKGRNNR